ncbi:hypothetical protein LWI29_028481 [Acer saccharum]|uniref:Uncharacterized protein n=1 Tax=Acer saccharum TaxID=4024 RepID=A0AA39S524_ACESA|nr:hypothetical protein LWI29_028481 [Acer saccharum]
MVGASSRVSRHLDAISFTCLLLHKLHGSVKEEGIALVMRYSTSALHQCKSSSGLSLVLRPWSCAALTSANCPVVCRWSCAPCVP